MKGLSDGITGTAAASESLGNRAGVGRRAFLATSAAAGTVVVAGSSSRALAVGTPLGVGESLGAWTVTAIDTAHAGATVVSLATADAEQTLRVLITRPETGGAAMIASEHFHFALINGGGGQTPTPAPYVNAVERLASRLDKPAALPGAAHLLTASERQKQYCPIDS